MRIPTLVGLAGLILATHAAAQDVTYDYAKGTDFARLKTYAWTTGHAVNDPLNHQRVMSAIESQLAAKGFIKVEMSANPDALVAYHASFAKNLEVNGFSSGWGGYRYGPGQTNRARVEEIVVGTLIVDIVDAKTSTIVWRGIASKDIDVDARPEQRDKQVNKAAEKLFKNYPGVK
jgi:hypothetical protein